RWRIVIRTQTVQAPITADELRMYVISLLVVILILSGLIAVVTDKEKREKLGKSIKTRKAKVEKEPMAVVEEFVFLTEDGELDHKKMVETIKENVEHKKESTTSPTFMDDTGVEVVTQMDVPQSIFRAYDIRGIVDETLTEQGVFLIGRAIASQALSVGQKTIAIARDGRLHSLRLSESLSKGIQSTGCKVIDVGQVPTPVLYFATHQLDTQSGVMITGSHNPANYNGLKIVIAGNTLSGDAIQQLYQRILQEDFESGEGSYQEEMMLPEYIGAITSDVRLGRMMKVVVDCGNGVAGEAAPMLLSTLGCEIIPLYCDIDGNFPNHHPDPSKPENLQELIDKVREEEAELGLAFDGDGDRLGVIDSDGNVIWPDRQMMLYAIDVLSRQAGADIIYDVKCTRNLAKVIAKHGGKPIMSKTGHSLIKAKMKETNAELAGEMSGHIFFKERWFGFDDALYTAARLLEVLTAEFRSTAEIFADLPDSVSTPELNVSLEEGENFIFVEQLQSQAIFEDANVITIDGVRVEFKDGWGLVRASNTTPSLVLRFEADDEVALDRIKDVFREQMLKINDSIALPF
ncbi:MAG: phosphoglucomutase, partial [Cycloclasticus sp. Phe_18]